ncbi:glycerol-3-phosphate responsive antiterminator [Caloramator sp. E03]|uniref:glycerol-3-phosphate responsive antiterminator n=1 Tax=Caloramator sp. E03 TaxID=2576307 RepID=UPI001110C84A|nr:glycerol-3-phosphate responsive antiterminator [Caloramator sp. E03]QCX34009.1 glycerol-3-phosphate responsive antiterminator [Caloramator sp. E03]
MRNMIEIIEDNPIIAAVRNLEELDKAINSSACIIFMLCGSIFNIKDIIDKIKKEGKYVFVHIDLVEGLGKDSVAVEFLKGVGTDGIITTKPSLIKDAKACGMYVVQRLFMLDSRSLETGIKSVIEDKPNAIEIMPAATAKVIKRIHEKIKIPVIAGGLVLEKSDVIYALSCGAVAVSTSQASLWDE